MTRRIPGKEEWAATAQVRNPGERAALCALALLAHRESGQVQERRLRLAGAATMGVATFRRHVAALAEQERGLIAISNPRTESGDHDETIYTLVGWLRLRGVSEPEALRSLARFQTERADSAAACSDARPLNTFAERAGAHETHAKAGLIVLSSAHAKSLRPEGGEVSEEAGSARFEQTRAFARTQSAQRRGQLKSSTGPGLDLLAWSAQFEQTERFAHKDKSLTHRIESPGFSPSSAVCSSGDVSAKGSFAGSIRGLPRRLERARSGKPDLGGRRSRRRWSRRSMMTGPCCGAGSIRSQQSRGRGFAIRPRSRACTRPAAN